MPGEERKELAAMLPSPGFNDPAQAVQRRLAAGTRGRGDEIPIGAPVAQRGDTDLGEPRLAAGRQQPDLDGDVALAGSRRLGERVAQAARVLLAHEVEKGAALDVVSGQTQGGRGRSVDRGDAEIHRADQRRVRHGVEHAAADEGIRHGYLRLSWSAIPRAAAMIRVRASLPSVTSRICGTTLSCGSAAKRRNNSG